jgi:hypothetical protein
MATVYVLTVSDSRGENTEVAGVFSAEPTPEMQARARELHGYAYSKVTPLRLDRLAAAEEGEIQNGQ